ncbi:MAG: hypothetical protein ACNA8W_00785 [Bradymonadaceae bacterium]
MKWNWMILSLVFVALGTSAPLSGAERQASSQGTLLLITEVVDRGADEEPQIAYWWYAPGEPAWTPTDQGVLQELKTRGVTHAVVGKTNISRIYRRPNLSLDNAATLGGLIGATEVIVGQVRYQVEPRLAQLGLHTVRAEVVVDLVSAQGSGARSLKRFTIERQVFAVNQDNALIEARKQTSRALGVLLASTLSKSAGPVGAKSEERLIGIRNAENSRILDQVMAFLIELDAVDAVQERWAAEGIIALEINPGRVDGDDVIEYVLRVLEHHSFDEFRLTRHQRGDIDDLAEFFVERVGAEGF